MKKLLTQLLITAIFIFPSSCSLRKIAFKQADWLVMYQIDKYFDIDSKQKEYLEPVVSKFIQWIKTQKSTELIQALDEARDSWQKGPTQSNVNDLSKKYNAFRIDVIDFIAVEAGVFLASLSDSQIRYLEKRLQKFNEESDDIAQLPSAKFNLKQQKRTIKQLGEWVSDLSDEQKDAFFAKVPPDQLAYRKYLDGRRTGQINFVEYLRTRKSASEISAQLKIWARFPHYLRRGSEEESRPARTATYILALHQIANTKQRQQVADRISDIIDDIKAFTLM